MSIVHFGPCATVREAPALHEAARAAIAESSNVTIDCSSMTRCDTAALQILLSLRNSLTGAGLTLQVTNVAPDLLWRFQFVGIAAHARTVPHIAIAH